MDVTGVTRLSCPWHLQRHVCCLVMPGGSRTILRFSGTKKKCISSNLNNMRISCVSSYNLQSRLLCRVKAQGGSHKRRSVEPIFQAEKDGWTVRWYENTIIYMIQTCIFLKICDQKITKYVPVNSIIVASMDRVRYLCSNLCLKIVFTWTMDQC